MKMWDRIPGRKALAGEYLTRAEVARVIYRGVHGKVNAGTSNDQEGENFLCCKIKALWVTLATLGLAGVQVQIERREVTDEIANT